ncbi:MAG TPA: hypothetical protein VGM90_09840 [Kofleriaceae bacterium]|jgi:hypothetical protein
MSKVQFSIVVVLLLAIGGASAAPLFIRPEPPKPAPKEEKKYAYRVEGFPDDGLVPALNEVGGKGWDVVSARRAMDGSSGIYELILRREVP